MHKKKSLLFISRAYPPIIGGIENQNKALFDNLSQHYSITKIINTRGKKFLPIFLPWAIIRSLFLLRTVDTIVLGDGVLSIAAWIIKKMKSSKAIICIVHGLDITYSNSLYQKLWVKVFFPSIDQFVSVSHHTKEILTNKGMSANKITVIANGFDFSSINFCPDKRIFCQLTGTETDKKCLLTIGRLVKRKGVTWFISEVIPQLDDAIVYIIAGTGPDEENIRRIVESKKLNDRVKLLGKVTEKEKQILLSNCELFIQPNIKTKNDIEGFGISVIEASAYGLPVIASNLEGLKDAIHHNKNGWLVKSGNAQDYIKKIESLLENTIELKKNGQSFQAYSYKHYSWESLIGQYIEIINKSNTHR